MKKIIRYIKNPKLIVLSFLINFGFWINDRIYLKLYFYLRMNKKGDFKNPKTFSEKLQWLKLNNRNQSYTSMVDKYLVKDYVSNKIGAKYIIPTIGVWDNFEDIDFDKLPESFVMKCTHDSGGLVICKNKKGLDIEQAKNKIQKSLNYNYFYAGREWVYKDVQPRIIVEKYMSEKGSEDLKDYKIFCFNGEPKIIQVDFDRFINHKRNMYDTEWNLLDFELQYPKDVDTIIDKPHKLSKMLELARDLSKDIPFLRVDFYIIDGELFFGELTFFPGCGVEKIQPLKWENKLGNMLRLPIDE